MTFQSLSVIVPVVSEIKSFVETVETIIRVCDKDDLKEIIICPAYFATEECKRTAEYLREKYKDVQVSIFMQEGKFEDVIKDLCKAVKGSHFIFQPADLEEDPKSIAVFIEESKNHPDSIVTGSRFLSKNCSKNCPKYKKASYALFRMLFKVVYARKLTDTTFTYRVIPTDKVNGLILNEKSYSVLYEMFLKILRAGTEVIEIPVEFNMRKDGKSNVGFIKEGLRFLLVFFRVRLLCVDKFYSKTVTSKTVTTFENN